MAALLNFEKLLAAKVVEMRRKVSKKYLTLGILKIKDKILT
jgi:hypothetical protein